jgi:hypothetical protein
MCVGILPSDFFSTAVLCPFQGIGQHQSLCVIRSAGKKISLRFGEM